MLNSEHNVPMIFVHHKWSDKFLSFPAVPKSKSKEFKQNENMEWNSNNLSVQADLGDIVGWVPDPCKKSPYHDSHESFCFSVHIKVRLSLHSSLPSVQ